MDRVERELEPSARDGSEHLIGVNVARAIAIGSEEGVLHGVEELVERAVFAELDLPTAVLVKHANQLVRDTRSGESISALILPVIRINCAKESEE